MTRIEFWSVVISSVVVIMTGIFAVVRPWHDRYVEDKVEDKIGDVLDTRLASIDNAVNHRKEGEPRLVEMVEDTLFEVKEMRQDHVELKLAVERLNTKVERHLGWHEGRAV